MDPRGKLSPVGPKLHFLDNVEGLEHRVGGRFFNDGPVFHSVDEISSSLGGEFTVRGTEIPNNETALFSSYYIGRGVRLIYSHPLAMDVSSSHFRLRRT